jgi:iron(III) transport system substrate-binding protein
MAISTLRTTRGIQRSCLAAVAATLAALSAACGSSGSSSGSGPSTGGGSSSAASTAPTQPSGGSGGPATASSSGGDLQSLYEAAKKEGKIVLWGGEDPAEMQQIFGEFSKTYPGLKLETTAVNPDKQATQLSTAKAAGQPLPDLIQGRKEFMPTISQSGFVDANPNWANYGVPSSIVGADGGLLEYRSVYVLAYNKNVIKDAADVPSTWQALADAKWKGKLSVDPRGFPFNIWAVSLGESGTVDYVKKLKSDVNPDLVQGSTAGLVKLSAGAQALRPAALEDVKTQLAKGAPLGYVIPTPVLVQDTSWYLTAGAPDKNAAMLFAIWYTSKDGGQVQTGKLDHRTNQLPDEAAGKEVVTYSTPEEAALVAKVTPEIVSAFGG